MKQIILASKSPRRKELLELMGLEFTITPAIKEEIITKSEPIEVVQELALQKAEEVFKQCQGEEIFVIGSDTIVYCDGEIMGKPADKEDAFRMIEKLQGKEHSVYTGVAFVWNKSKEYSSHVFFEETKVAVFSMEENEIWDYIKTGEPMDKA